MWCCSSCAHLLEKLLPKQIFIRQLWHSHMQRMWIFQLQLGWPLSDTELLRARSLWGCVSGGWLKCTIKTTAIWPHFTFSWTSVFQDVIIHSSIYVWPSAHTHTNIQCQQLKYLGQWECVCQSYLWQQFNTTIFNHVKWAHSWLKYRCWLDWSLIICLWTIKYWQEETVLC